MREGRAPKPKRRRINVPFAARVEALRAFRDAHGHWPLVTDDRRLHHFCLNVRCARRHPERARMKLDPGKVALLDAIGFAWSPPRGAPSTLPEQKAKQKAKRDKLRRAGQKAKREKRRRAETARFAQWVEALGAFRRARGRWPSPADDQGLCSFGNNARYARQHPAEARLRMDDDRIALLDAIGFKWRPGVSRRPAEPWDRLPRPPRVSRAQSGSEGGSSGHEDEDEDEVDGSREGRGRSREHAEFSDRVEALAAFHDEHGHYWPSLDDDELLYQFCRDARHARRHPQNIATRLDCDRIAMLDAITFDWRPTTFDGRVAALRAFRSRHGHCRPSAKEDRDLYDFCRRARRARQCPGKDRLLSYRGRIARLDAVGFEWMPGCASMYPEVYRSLHFQRHRPGRPPVAAAAGLPRKAADGAQAQSRREGSVVEPLTGIDPVKPGPRAAGRGSATRHQLPTYILIPCNPIQPP